MLIAACLTIALATLGLCCLCAYWAGYTRRVRESEGYLTGRTAGIRVGRAEGMRERDELRERLAELATAVDTAYEEARALSDEVSR